MNRLRIGVMDYKGLKAISTNTCHIGKEDGSIIMLIRFMNSSYTSNMNEVTAAWETRRSPAQ